MPTQNTETKRFATTISPLKIEANINNIVSRVKTTMDSPTSIFYKANTLKHKIDGFGVGRIDFNNPKTLQRQMNDAEKNLLEQAETDYKEIQSEKKNIHASLNQIGSLFDEKTQQSTKLSKNARNIESKLNEIDTHLSEYEDKFKLFEERDDDKTDEEIAWEVAARKQMTKLQCESKNLSNSLSEIYTLQTYLDNTENTTIKELEELLVANSGEGTPRPNAQSAEAIRKEMAEIRGKIFDFSARVSGICATASNLLSNLFESIKNISSKIAKQFESANATLAESSELLSTYPPPKMQARL